MAITMLDPNTALIIVDLQRGLVGSAFIHPIDDIVTRACALIDAFRRRSLPIVLVNVDGTAPGRTERPRHAGQFPDGWTDLSSELGPAAGRHRRHEADMGRVREHRSRDPAERRAASRRW